MGDQGTAGGRADDGSRREEAILDSAAARLRRESCRRLTERYVGFRVRADGRPIASARRAFRTLASSMGFSLRLLLRSRGIGCPEAGHVYRNFASPVVLLGPFLLT